MRSNIKLGTISGIEIGLHYSWFIIAALIAFSLSEHFRQVNPSWGPGLIWIAALVTALLFFVTLLLHELAHSLVAQARGLKVRAITLFALGGVSQIQDDATDAKTELLVAIAGPVASLIISVGCLAIALGLGWHRSTEPQTAVTGVLVWLGYINIALAVFNMIPGFPLDGGRVLRAIVWAITKNADHSHRRARRAIRRVSVHLRWDMAIFFWRRLWRPVDRIHRMVSDGRGQGQLRRGGDYGCASRPASLRGDVA
jgi:Zn-dependent protease